MLPSAAPPQHNAWRLIAQDFLKELIQVDKLPAASTTLNIPARQVQDDPFSAQLKEQLEDAGYGIRMVGSNPNDKLVSYTLSDTIDAEYGKCKCQSKSATICR